STETKPRAWIFGVVVHQLGVEVRGWQNWHSSRSHLYTPEGKSPRLCHLDVSD
ncbi:hypothetical protein RUM43_004064, partial [Polyplax serrata]